MLATASLLQLLMVVAAAAAAARSTNAPKAGQVLELTEETFDASIQKDVWLVDVYATWWVEQVA